MGKRMTRPTAVAIVSWRHESRSSWAHAFRGNSPESLCGNAYRGTDPSGWYQAYAHRRCGGCVDAVAREVAP